MTSGFSWKTVELCQQIVNSDGKCLTWRIPNDCIVYNDAEDTAVLCTFSPLVTRRMAKLCSKTSSIIVRKQTDDYAEYVFPKKMVKIVIPRQYSEEKRKIMSDRAKQLFGRDNDDSVR